MHIKGTEHFYTMDGGIYTGIYGDLDFYINVFSKQTINILEMRTYDSSVWCEIFFVLMLHLLSFVALRGVKWNYTIEITIY